MGHRLPDLRLDFATTQAVGLCSLFLLSVKPKTVSDSSAHYADEVGKRSSRVQSGRVLRGRLGQANEGWLGSGLSSHTRELPR